MILNINKNKTGNVDNIFDLIDVSQKVIIQMLEEKNEVTKEDNSLITASFQNSLKLAKLDINPSLFTNKKNIINKMLDNLTINNNSFLIQPISYTLNNHKVCALIRKKDDGSFTFMINDKSQKSKNHSNLMHLEYTVKDKDELIEIMLHPKVKSLAFLGTKHGRITKGGFIKLESFQTHIEYNIPTTPQIIGNCFLKEIEFGIKNAIMTRKHSFRDIEKNGLKSQLKLDNEEFQTRYVKELLNKYKDKLSSSFMVKIDNKIENYLENKIFIRNIKKFIKENATKSDLAYEVELKIQLPKIFKTSFKTDSFKDAFEKQNFSTMVKTMETGMLFIDPLGIEKGSIRSHIYNSVIINLCKEYTDKYKEKIGTYEDLLGTDGKPIIIGPISKNSRKSYLDNREIYKKFL